jgi:hypothetical protein
VGALGEEDRRLDAVREDQLKASYAFVFLAVDLLVLQSYKSDCFLGWERLKVLWSWPFEVRWRLGLAKGFKLSNRLE